MNPIQVLSTGFVRLDVTEGSQVRDGDELGLVKFVSVLYRQIANGYQLASVGACKELVVEQLSRATDRGCTEKSLSY